MVAVVTQAVATVVLERFAAVPAELRARPHWVNWRPVPIPGKLKPTKVPYVAGTDKKASTTDLTTWRTFASATHSERIGYVFSAEDPYTGIDFDHCRDPQTGEIAPDVLAEILAFKSYAEVSASGDGVHVWIRAVMPNGGKGCHVGDFEAYDRGRFFTVTGQQLDGTPTTINEAQEALDAFCRAHFPPKESKQSTPNGSTSPAPISASDSELLMRLRNQPGERGARFCALFDRGDLAGYGDDESAADLALCNDLAYGCGPGSDARIDDLFRQSALMRDKWERADYRTWTIDTALSGRTAFLCNVAQETQTGQESGNHAAQNQTVLRDPPSPPPAACCGHIEELVQLREALRLAEEANARLRARLAWDRELRAVTHLPPAHKLTLLAVRDVADRRPARPGQTEIPVYLPDIGQRCGRVTADKVTGEVVGNGQTAGAHLSDCENYGILEYHVRRDPADGHTHSSVITLPPLDSPKAITAPPRAPQGGKRDGAGRPQRCMSCGSVELVERTIVETVCATCGEIAREQVGRDRVVNVEMAGADAPPDTSEKTQEAGNSPQVNQTVLRDPATAPDLFSRAPDPAPESPLPPSVAEPEQHSLTAAPFPPGIAGLAGPVCIQCRTPKRWHDGGYVLSCACGSADVEREAG